MLRAFLQKLPLIKRLNTYARKQEKKKSKRSATQASADPSPELDPVPELQRLEREHNITCDRFHVAVKTDPETDRIVPHDRHDILLGLNRTVSVHWQVDSLTSLFRGDAIPPSPEEMEHYPERYVGIMYGIESDLLLYFKLEGFPRDADFLDIYTQMRRRPDGRSLGILHDVVWRATCLELGRRCYSQAEYEAVFRQLARSARHFKIGPASRNYANYVRRTFTPGDGEPTRNPPPPVYE